MITGLSIQLSACFSKVSTVSKVVSFLVLSAVSLVPWLQPAIVKNNTNINGKSLVIIGLCFVYGAKIINFLQIFTIISVKPLYALNERISIADKNCYTPIIYVHMSAMPFKDVYLQRLLSIHRSTRQAIQSLSPPRSCIAAGSFS
jgi:hypothetical protein